MVLPQVREIPDGYDELNRIAFDRFTKVYRELSDEEAEEVWQIIDSYED